MASEEAERHIHELNERVEELYGQGKSAEALGRPAAKPARRRAPPGVAPGCAGPGAAG
jgi:hypothetical protein